ncbi:MAG: ATP-binding protein [Crocinitomicaceae bacterium]|nr:MAG: ATP-binding protein [Crocinitomicaceae bacterium]
MKRNALHELEIWKNSTRRKPLIIKGARQVGKTWIMKEFGKTHYQQVAYINFEQSEILKTTFVTDFNIQRIIRVLQIETGIQIDPTNTLILFDEIQEAPKGITALKYFYENAPEYHIIAAGSLLGVTIHPNTSFPVGKVDFLDLYPMDFDEFLQNTNPNGLHEVLQQKDKELLTIYHERLVEQLRLYYYLGGMPEVIASYIENNNLEQAREIQKRILSGYEQDFSKHAPIEIVPRIRLVWNAILKQLSKENKKFIYNTVRPGARAKDFETAINWLADTGLIYKVNRVESPKYPLIAYADLDVFKLFILDIGLLGAMGDLSSKTLLNKNKILTEFKGALTEQYVLQSLNSNKKIRTYYWSSDSGTAEIDFLIQLEDQIIPIEVKAEENLQAKSLKVFVEKFKATHAVRTSMSPYRIVDWLENIPLYAINLIETKESNQVKVTKLTYNSREDNPFIVNEPKLNYNQYAKIQITEEQQKIINYLKNKSKKRKDILEDCLKISNQTKNFKHHIEPLIEQGIIELTIKDKPKSQNQQYQLTAFGKNQLKQPLT